MQIFRPDGGVPIKAWTDGVAFDENARAQVTKMAQLPFIHRHIAIMPDVHQGKGATVGSVVPTYGAIVPAAVGVDIGCGMMAVRTTLRAQQLPDSLAHVRGMIEAAQSLGMRPGTILRAIELPLATSTILAGIKTSAVINVGTATIAAFIGAGGYGERTPSRREMPASCLLQSFSRRKYRGSVLLQRSLVLSGYWHRIQRRAPLI